MQGGGGPSLDGGREGGGRGGVERGDDGIQTEGGGGVQEMAQPQEAHGVRPTAHRQEGWPSTIE